MSKFDKQKEKMDRKGFGCKVQCLGDEEVCVEGCKGILQYEQDTIRVNVGSKQIVFSGQNLSIPVLERDFVQIHGTISKIEFI